MEHGFEYFDSNQRENFIAAMLLLVIEVDRDVRDALCRDFRKCVGLSAAAELRDAGREASLVGESESSRRSDLWLRFDDGVGLIELKSHGAWDPVAVAAQLRDQAGGRLKNIPGKVLGVLLLAPRLLHTASTKNFLSWGTIVRTLRTASPKGELSKRVVTHLETYVERDIGLPEGGHMNVRETARQVAILREFLTSCFVAVGGTAESSRALYTTHGDGEPRREGEWGWYGISVPFKYHGESYRVGVYEYTETPAERSDAKEHAWLEAYQMNGGDLIVELPFDGSLASADLEGLRSRFANAWSASKVLK